MFRSQLFVPLHPQKAVFRRFSNQYYDKRQ